MPSFHSSLVSSIEVLESRIAPAALLLGQDFNPKNAAATAGLDTTDATAVGATKAYALKAGQSIVLDLNSNGKADTPAKGDLNLVNITGGKALIFLTDLNNDGKFQTNEITGLAVSDGFNGTVNADINGSVVTALNKTTGAFSGGDTLLDASITSLIVSGGVSGDVLAGRNIAKLTIGTSASSDLSVSHIRAGTSASQSSVSYNGGANLFTISDFTPADGAAGGSIGGTAANTIKLAKGVLAVSAGDGGAGGDGGKVNGLTITTQGSHDLAITAGAGVDSDSAAGGDGGGISNLSIGAMSGALTISAGNGGAGGQTETNAFAGGAGGAVKSVNASLQSGSVEIISGIGGAGGFVEIPNPESEAPGTIKGGNGGAGGAISKVPVTALGNLDSLKVTGGDGGIGHGPGKSGGAGNDVDGVTQLGTGAISSVEIVAGSAGETGDGGSAGKNGGDVLGVTLTKVTDSLTIHAGNGAAGNSYLHTAGAGGIGGSIGGAGKSSVSAILTSASTVAITAGSGGAGGSFIVDPVENPNTGEPVSDGYTGGAAGGKGGAVNNLTLNVTGNGAAEVSVTAGAGGDGNGNKAGGAGGDILGSTVTVSAASSVLIQAGAGGIGGTDGNTHGGVSGDGGDITGLSFSSDASPTSAKILAGNGGNAPDDEGGGGVSTLAVAEEGDVAGGKGGKISDLTLNTTASLLEVTAGKGGNGTGIKSGANGGGISGVQGSAVAVIFTTGAGGAASDADDATGDSGDGGAATNISDFTATALTIITGAGGDSAGIFAGGKGGEISHIKATIDSGNVTFTTGVGGAGGTIFNPETNVSKGGVGGDAGKISDVTLTADGGASQVFAFTTGQGGEGQVNKIGGKGGAVFGLSVTAKSGIQDFAINAGNGGAGQGDPDDDKSVGNAGGAITKVKLTVEGTIAGMAAVIAGNGGAGTLKPGFGGSIKTVALNTVPATDFAYDIQAGSGGNDDSGFDGDIASDVTVNGNPPADQSQP
jgi:hypothetical protein